MKMERLEMKLNEFANGDIPLVPHFKPVPLSHNAYETLLHIKDTVVENLFDISGKSLSLCPKSPLNKVRMTSDVGSCVGRLNASFL